MLALRVTLFALLVLASSIEANDSRHHGGGGRPWWWWWGNRPTSPPATTAPPAAGTATVNLATQCGQTLTFAQGSLQAVNIISHTGAGRTRWRRSPAYNCGLNINMGTCTSASFVCSTFHIPSTWGCGYNFLMAEGRRYCFRGAPRGTVGSAQSPISFLFRTVSSSWLRGRGFSCTLTCTSFSGTTVAPTTVTTTTISTASTTTVSTASTTTTTAVTTTDPSRCICGQTGVRMNPQRIVNGVNAGVGEIPWQVGLSSSGPGTTTTLQIFCGGTLINERWVLSAAHCTVNDPATNPPIFAWLGLIDRRVPSQGRAFAISRNVVHPSYNAASSDNDFALLQLSTNVDFAAQRSVSPACWASRNEVPGSLNAVISGWGTLFSGGPQPNILQKASVDIIAFATCANSYTLTSNMVCAAHTNAVGQNIDSCQGDSGGPLVNLNTASSPARYEVIGATSFGRGCAQTGFPGVYADVFAQRAWIASIAGNECSRT